MIKISELIKQLESIKETHGDILMMFEEEGFGGEAIHFVEGAKLYEIYSDLIEDASSNVKELKVLFPEWEGSEEEFYDRSFKPAKCAMITSGSMLYST